MIADLRRRLFVTIVATLVFGSTLAESPVAEGYREAVFSVSDAEAWKTVLVDIAGWQVRHEGDVPRSVLSAWGLPDSASATEIIVGNPGTKRGFIRLVEFSGVEQLQIRSNAQSWDTGGIFDVNVRVVDMQRKFDELQAANWQAATDPVEFSFGPFVVKEWLVRGPDGIVFALIERVAPPLEGWPALREMSRLFNATQIVRDFEAARSFYLDDLGFSVYLEHEGASKNEGPNVLGLPHNLTTQVPRKVIITHPDGSNEGSIEILAFDGVTGTDFSERAVPPNLGILMLRFPVKDIDAFASHAKDRNLDIVTPVTRMNIVPYGETRMIGVRGPEGALFEFFEEADGTEPGDAR